MLTYMQDTIQAYFESYGDNGQYYQLPVDYDDQSLPTDIIKGHEYETFNAHNYVTKRPYHDTRKMPYVEMTTKTFTAQYHGKMDVKAAIKAVNGQINTYIKNVSASLAQFNTQGLKTVTDYYDLKFDSHNDTEQHEVMTTVYFVKR